MLKGEKKKKKLTQARDGKDDFKFSAYNKEGS